MTSSEQFHKNRKVFSDQVSQIEQHIKDHKLYTSFDFGRLRSNLTEYEAWVQANTSVIEAALRVTPTAA